MKMKLSTVLLLAMVGLLQQCITAASSLQVQPAAVVAAAVVTQPLDQQDDGAQPASAHNNGTVVLPGEPDPASEAMLAWLRQYGAEVNVAIRRNVPGAGRSTFAPRDFHKGDVLARIPVEMTYALSDQDESLATSASYLMADMAEPGNPWEPYFNALPGPEDVWSTSHVPESYMPIIQDDLTERAIMQMQSRVQNLWEAFGSKYQQVLGPNVSPANITYGMGLLLSRLFRFDDTDVLLPIVDMANHDNACLHSHLPEPCDPELGRRQWEEDLTPTTLSNATGSGYYNATAPRSGQCMVWRAEEFVAAGQPVCNSYKTLTQDRALLQYGFLQSDSAQFELNTLDRHERIMEMAHVWTDIEGADGVLGPRRFEGTPAQAWAEVDRLSERLEMLKQGDAAVAAIKPDKERDPSGRYLAEMREWRRQRKAAISSEINRVVAQARRLEKAQKAWGLPADAAAGRGAGAQKTTTTGLTTINSALLQWLEANGAQVNVELQHLQPETLIPINSTPKQVCTTTSDSVQQSCPAQDGSAAGASIIPNAGVFTREEVTAGDVMAAIPVNLGYEINPGTERLDSAVDLTWDIHESLGADITADTAASTLASMSVGNTTAAFMLSLPPIGTVHSLYNFPQEYLPMLQSKRMTAHIKRLQKALHRAFDSHRSLIEAYDNSTSFAQVQHAASLLSTRPILPLEIGGQEKSLLLPLFSNARHSSSCPHDYYFDTCPTSNSKSSSKPANASNLCFFWVAGANLSAGAEVCVSFGHLRQDQALLMYGLPVDQSDMLQQAQGSTVDSSSSSAAGGGIKEEVWMHGMDTADATSDQPFGPVAAEPLTHWEPGTRDEALAECLWLIELHTNWTEPEAAAELATLQPVPSDAAGAFLDQLTLWRQRRIQAVEAELGRLSEMYNISSAELVNATKARLVSRGSDKQQTAPGISSNFTSNSTDPWQRMLDWMRHNGAIINVNVTYAGPAYGRVVVAAEPVTRGDLLAAIPLDLCWNTVTAGGNGSMQLAAANLWAEIDSPTSPWKPYLDALPSQDEMMCPLVSLPPAYQHLLQNENAVEFIQGYQANVMEFWEEHGADMATQLPSMTLDAFKYARGLLATRLFGLEVGASMVPLLDLANHAPLCPNIHSEQPCPHDPERQCIVWTAGSFHAKGGEVCNGYKYMANDRSMLQYGFLQSGYIKDALHTIDHPIISHTTMFSVFDKMKFGPAPFNGTKEETQEEVARLKERLANVTSGDAAAAATKADPSDKSGRLLSLLLRWREERKATLQKEIDRQEARLADMAAAAAGSLRVVTAEEKLVEWLKDNGAQINGLRIGQPGDNDAAAAPEGGRAVIATKAIKQGSIMAAIPLDLSLPVNTENMLYDGPMLWTEVIQRNCPRGAYYATLPKPEEAFSFYEIPLEYAPVVQHEPTEEYLQKTVRALDSFKIDNLDQFTARNMTEDDMRHIFTLVATRLIHFREGGHLVPFLDMANHKNGCKHNIGVRPCDELTPSASKSNGNNAQPSTGLLNTTRVCVYWKAGADLNAGEEVCLPYGYMLPDRAMLQYGFLPAELSTSSSAADLKVPLFGMDRHDFKQLSAEGLPWGFWNDNDTSPEPFSSTRRQTSLEITRLQWLAVDLEDGEAAAAAVQPVASVDADGSVLAKLRRWRELRKVAIAQEIERLQRLQEIQ